jgi:hypothetical protein
LGSGDVAVQETLVSGTNIKTINSTSLLGSGNITIAANPSGVSGAIQFSNGSAFASDAANLFWDDTNKRLGIGTNVPTSKLTITDGASSINFGSDGGGAFIRPSGNMSIYSANSSQFAFITNSGVGINVNPTARFHIKGSGSTSATTSLLVQNSAGTTALQITDNGNMSILYNRITDGTNNDKSLYFLPDNTAVLSNYGKISLRVNDGLGWNSGLEVVGTGTESRVGIGITSPNASAKLQIDSTTKGFLPPRMTTTQKNAIASPAAGLVLYDSTTNKLQCYNGSTWNDLF